MSMTAKKKNGEDAPVPASAEAERKGGYAKDFMGAKVEKTFNEKNAPLKWRYEWDEGNIKAEIYRQGQNHASISDEVVAMLKVSLKAEKSSLIEKYNFGERILFMNYSLKKNWGMPEEDWRYETKSAEAKTWSEAFEKLEAILLQNVRVLLTAIENRKKALEDAEQ
jgi:hypothetical protein